MKSVKFADNAGGPAGGPWAEVLCFPAMTHPAPFWKTRTLEEFSAEEWESLCDRCGRCCMFKVRSQGSETQHHTDVACRLLNRETGQCSDYPNRLKLVHFCDTLTPTAVRALTWLPATCGYRRVAEGKDLDWWHPLISGDPDTVRQAGISMRGRAIDESKAGKLEYHVVSWPGAPTDADGTLPMRWRALFGGANADLLTPLHPDLSIDLDRMAAHAFRMLELGCDGLRVLGSVGEGDAFSPRERVVALEGLVERGLPPSKIMPDIRAAEAMESLAMARHAADLGCRAAILPIGRSGGDWLETSRQMADSLKGVIHLYVDAMGMPDAVLANVAPRDMTGRIQGLLATGHNAASLAARFAESGTEVLGDDTADLCHLLGQGGGGCISAIANIATRLPAYVCRDWRGPGAAVARSVTGAIAGCLTSVPLVPGLKALLARQTGDSGWLTVRPPLQPLPAPLRDVLFMAYDRARAKPAP